MQRDPLPVIEGAIQVALNSLADGGSELKAKHEHIARAVLEQLEEAGLEIVPIIPDAWTDRR